MKEIIIDRKSKLNEIIMDALIYSPLFDALSENELKVVANHMKLFELEKGGILFEEGDKGDYVCFVVDGVMDILKQSAPESSAVIASLSKGRSIGEMAVIDNFPRSATVRARTKTSFLMLTQKSFDTILRSHPETGITILKGISRLLSLNLRKTSSRLADYLLPVT